MYFICPMVKYRSGLTESERNICRHYPSYITYKYDNAQKLYTELNNKYPPQTPYGNIKLPESHICINNGSEGLPHDLICEHAYEIIITEYNENTKRYEYDADPNYPHTPCNYDIPKNRSFIWFIFYLNWAYMLDIEFYVVPYIENISIHQKKELHQICEDKLKCISYFTGSLTQDTMEINLKDQYEYTDNLFNECEHGNDTTM